ncbi:TetR/AcrR family transcriptional regulator [Nocardia sp. NPDC058658]|uniref:TetR/AcrR family transcriptional regulator n=1 Tax=Nocardia sp. NPDC058658 TaxID=3346580 RepID=UPI00366099F2
MAQTASGKALSAKLIADAAVKVADVEGLDAITMRRLATELGVTPMAAYRHVSNKDEVLELMVDLVYGEIDPPAGTDWRATLWAIAQAVRTLILRHPWLTRLSAPQMLYELTPHRLALTEQALTALHDDGGLDLDAAMAACRTLSTYVQGATSSEIGLRDLMDDHGCPPARIPAKDFRRRCAGYSPRAATRPSSATFSKPPARMICNGNSTPAWIRLWTESRGLCRDVTANLTPLAPEQ